jgi:hypothetical protein
MSGNCDAPRAIPDNPVCLSRDTPELTACKSNNLQLVSVDGKILGSLSKHTTTTIKHTAIPDQE